MKPQTRRHAVANAPERTDKSKRRLLRPNLRALKILRWRRRKHVAFLALVESGSVMVRALRGRRRLRGIYAAPNSIIRGHRLGNGAIYDRWAFEVLDVDEFRVPLHGRGRPLSMLVLLLRDRLTGHRHVAIVRHLPRNVQRIDPGRVARAGIDRETARRAEMYAATLPVAIYSDSNGAPPTILGFRTASREGVESIVTSGFWVVRNGADRLPGAIDHRAVVWADLRPTRINVTAERLP